MLWNGEYDEEDDIEKWNNKTEDDEEYQRVLEAKRKRRLQQKKRSHNGDDDDEDDDDDVDFDNDPTVIDQQTSLGADQDEGIAIEPFHMKQEETDGSGYFDGDTYVFRRAKEEEPDAWLDMLDEKQQQQQQSDSKPFAAGRRKNNNSNSSPSSSEPSEDVVPPSRTELIGNMIPLVSDTETVVQALVRYGNLLQAMRKQQQLHSKQPQQSTASTNDTNNNDSASATAFTTAMAQSSLNSLTEAANELMLQHGMVDIYQQTLQDLLQLLSDDEDANGQQDGNGATTTTAAMSISQATSNSDQPNDANAPNNSSGVEVQWEYMGNEDGQVHGPFSTADMLAWTIAGYFVGEQAVQVRSISTSTFAQEEDNQVTLQEDLLADLMDDDDDDNNGNGENNRQGQDKAAGNGSKAAPTVARGEWISSNQVDFASYSGCWVHTVNGKRTYRR